MSNVSDVFGLIVKGALVGVDTCNTYMAIDEIAKGKGPDWLKASLIINRLVLLGFSLEEIGLLIKGSPSSTLCKIKNIELLPRLVEIPLRVTDEALKVEDKPNAESILRLIERGVIAPLADIGRVGAEAAGYNAKHYLEMSPEEIANATWPIYEQDPTDDFPRIVGYEPVDIEVCKKMLEDAGKAALGLGLIRIGAEAQVIGRTYKLTKNIYQRIASYFCNQGRNLPQIQRRGRELRRQSSAESSASQPLAQQVFSLHALPSIPEPFHDDVLFQRYICPITQVPIRYPVKDPTSPHYYERAAIIEWLFRRQISPTTNLPLTAQDLQQCPAVQALIENRLGYHEQKLWDYVASSPDLLRELNNVAETI